MQQRMNLSVVGLCRAARIAAAAVDWVLLVALEIVQARLERRHGQVRAALSRLA